MKSLVIAAILFCGQMANANEFLNTIHVSCIDEYNQLDDSEESKLALALDNWVVENVYNAGVESEHATVVIKYSCSQVPLMKVYCNATVESEHGALAALALTYDRNIDEPAITDSSTDF